VTKLGWIIAMMMVLAFLAACAGGVVRGDPTLWEAAQRLSGRNCHGCPPPSIVRTTDMSDEHSAEFLWQTPDQINLSPDLEPGTTTNSIIVHEYVHALQFRGGELPARALRCSTEGDPGLILGLEREAYEVQQVWLAEHYIDWSYSEHLLGVALTCMGWWVPPSPDSEGPGT